MAIETAMKTPAKTPATAVTTAMTMRLATATSRSFADARLPSALCPVAPPARIG
jgi:hypothetical protein